jgi:N-methylhydantoinase B
MSFDPLTITVVHDLLVSVAEEMGEALVGAASSPNIKERRDSSCALFDARGEMIAQASHIPVHLGSLASSVREALALDLRPGDMVLLNDPFRGGAHLPDLTLVAPFFDGGERPAAFVASRAHHADVGGMAPGSLPPAREIFQEGLIIPPVRLVRGGEIDSDLLNIVLANSRTPDERRGDLLAQIGANRVGLRRLEEILENSGRSRFEGHVAELLAYSEARVRALIRLVPEGRWNAEDHLDDDGWDPTPVPIRVTVIREGDDLVIDFSGSAPQTTGNVNAVEAVTRSAVLYVLCALAGQELPINAGCLRPIRFLLPERSVVNASPPAAVAAGNTETSQRIVDVLLLALAPVFPERIPAASQGTMNNLSLGGTDEAHVTFAYYETIAGGMGAGPGGPGLDAVHVHMTNTRNTPVEVLESTLPLRVKSYAVRRGSGGAGAHRGGDGVIREFTFLVPVTVSLHSDRRTHAPYGLKGGEPGACGVNTRVTADGRFIELPGKVLYNAAVGERLILRTPGGGGFCAPPR